MSIRDAIGRTIHRRSPPTAPVSVHRTIVIVRIISVIGMRIGITEPSRTVNKVHRPAMPWIVRHPESPSTGTRIVTSASPGAISPPCPVNHHFTSAIRRKISSCISHVNHLGRRVIDLNITDIVNRTRRRDYIYMYRASVADNPGT
jgi:hypothetical protein